MPIYEYLCKKCHDEFEMIQNFSDTPLAKCKKCGGRLQKLVSESAFHLKGSGWYVTDYGKTTRANPSEKSKPGETNKTENKSIGSSDSPAKETKTPEAKSSSKAE